MIAVTLCSYTYVCALADLCTTVSSAADMVFSATLKAPRQPTSWHVEEVPRLQDDIKEGVVQGVLWEVRAREPRKHMLLCHRRVQTPSTTGTLTAPEHS
jgi:hypothetical protein